MKRFLQYLREQPENPIDLHQLDYDKNYDRSFHWAYTPDDQEGTFSLVTPYNGDAWKNWEPVSPEHSEMLRDKWHEHRDAGTLTNFVAPHKARQIQRYAIS